MGFPVGSLSMGQPGSFTMSAPRTNLETEKRRHIGPLLGMAAVVIFAVGLIIYWQFEEAAQGNSPDPTEQPADRAGDATAPLPDTGTGAGQSGTPAAP